MKRIASRMKVCPDCFAEYQRRHDEIWPEMRAELKAHGYHNYAIFLDEKTGDLFAFAEIEDEARCAAMADTAVCRRWWDSMKALMEVNPDNSPRSADLREVFFLP